MLLNKKMLLILSTVLLIICVFSGCVNKEDKNIQSFQDKIKSLTDKTNNLVKENEELKKSLETAQKKYEGLQNELDEAKKVLEQYEAFPPSISYGYLDKTNFYVFVEKETNIKILPFDNAQDVNIVFANSLVKVLDKADVQNDEKFWYYVAITVYDTPLDTRGWIRVEETIPYTKSIQSKVVSPITVKKGSKIYENDSPFDNNKAKYTILDYRIIGMIEQRHEGYAKITSGGGKCFWTKEDNIVFPDIKE
jgi:outer membrane murein-binding lipoprotein Lpp